jgi:small subunit ribosomal protein S9
MEEKEIKTENEKSEEKEEKKEEKKKKKKKKVVISFARRKEAKARARIKEGKGKIKINSYAIDTIKNEIVRDLILDPINLAKDYVNFGEIDISVNVRGGGSMGQAQAARAAIAKALVDYARSSELRKKMLAYDRYLLVDDVRVVEPKKYKGRKARARFQKSYR